MCLRINEKLTEKSLKGRKIHSNGMVKLWKVVSWKSDIGTMKLLSPHYGDYAWKPGWNVSDRPSKRLLNNEKKDKRVYEGIHVLMTRESARIFKYNSEMIIPVYVEKTDFLAAGWGRGRVPKYFKSAVFNKVFLKQSDYDAAIKKAIFAYKRKNAKTLKTS